MTDLYCRACGKLRGELSALCSECLKQRTIDALSGCDYDASDRYRMEDTVRQGDRERERAVKNSDGRFYHGT